MCNVALNCKDVIKRPIITLLPQMRIGFCVDQLRADSDTICGALHASLDHMLDAEFIRDLAQVSFRATLVLHH